MTDVSLHEMIESDYDAALQLWLSDPSFGVSPQFDTRSRIAAYLSRNPGLSTIAKYRDQLIGTALCGHDGRRGSMFHVIVDPRFRRQGIARQMVERCLDGLKNEGIDTGYLFTLHDNEQAVKFWNSIGWKAFPNILYHYSDF